METMFSVRKKTWKFHKPREHVTSGKFMQKSWKCYKKVKFTDQTIFSVLNMHFCKTSNFQGLKTWAQPLFPTFWGNFCWLLVLRSNLLWRRWTVENSTLESNSTKWLKVAKHMYGFCVINFYFKMHYNNSLP